MLREADCLAKMNIQIPVVALAILARRDHFVIVKDSLQLVLEEFCDTARQVKHEMRPLLLPHLMRVAYLLKPALDTLTWTNPGWKDFCKITREQIKTFDILITRVHDVYINRYTRRTNIKSKTNLL